MTKLTAERLAELRRLCEAATPGPWETTAEVSEDQDHLVLVANGAPIADVVAETLESERPEADARLIAAARTALPELIAEVERLQAENNALRLAGPWHPPWHPCGTSKELTWAEQVNNGPIVEFEYHKCPTCPPEPEDHEDR